MIEYAILKEYLTKNVKNIFWLYWEGNDLDNLKKELKNQNLINYLDINYSQNLTTIDQKRIDEIIQNKLYKHIKLSKKSSSDFNNLSIIKFFKLYYLRQLINFKINNIIEKRFTKIDELKLILNNAKKISIANNSKFYFVYLPEYKRYSSSYYDNSNYELIKSIVTELGIPFVDVNKEVFNRKEDFKSLFPFGITGHYNTQGYKEIAEKLYKLTQ